MIKNQDPSKPSSLIYILTAIIAVFLLIYTLYNRPACEIIKNCSIIILIIILASFLLLYKIFNLKKSPSAKEKQDFYTLTIFFSLMGCMFYFISVIITDFENLIIKIFDFDLSNEILFPIIILIMLIVGLFLFYFRFYYRFVYGITETIVGLIIAVVKVSSNEQVDNINFFIAVLTASLFLIVRGFDNIHQGLNKEPRDLLAVKIIKRLKSVES